MLRLRQICLIARELDPAIADLEAVLGITTCHRDPAVKKFGLVNALLPIGNNFLEVVAHSRRHVGPQFLGALLLVLGVADPTGDPSGREVNGGEIEFIKHAADDLLLVGGVEDRVVGLQPDHFRVIP